MCQYWKQNSISFVCSFLCFCLSMITNEKCGLRWPLSLKLCPLLYYLIYFHFVLIEKVSCEQKMNMKFYLFSTGEGPIGWVSMFTLYYRFKFFIPPSSIATYSQKESSLEGSHWLSVYLFFVLFIQLFYAPYELCYLFPKGEVYLS